MDIKKLYKQKLISIEDAVQMVKSDQKICISMAASEPRGLLSALSKRKDELTNVRIISCLIMGEYDIFKPEMKGHFFNETWFYGSYDRKNHPYGIVSYIPNNLHEAGPGKIKNDSIDIFWGTATPMDRHGFFSLSLGITYEKGMIEAADLVILEINENLPWTLGDTQVHISEIDFFAQNNAPLFELTTTEPTKTEQLIGAHIAELIQDGSTIQLGIGGIPNAITKYLFTKKDLGVHTEMLTDGMVDLFKAGVINNRKKSIHKGKMIGTFALGSQKLYDFIDHNLGIELKPGPYTNDPYIIGQNYQMVSINTTLQVDLTGQCCSEALGNKQYTGTGGQVDTHRGAQRSPGGKGIIALESTTKGGQISKIVTELPQGSKVTLGRNDIDYVVTEFGVAHLKGISLQERVRELIKIAHPDFRAELKKEAEKVMLW